MGDTPKYKNPPVVETVLGVQFPELEGFRATHFGLYWDSLRTRYPEVTDQSRLDPVQERFPRPLIPQPQLQVMRQMPLGRVWLTAKSESELIQVQSDRFLFNWRRRDSEGEYPSYENNSAKFFEEFDGFRQFCREKQLPDPTPELCEVTYVNHIKPQEDETAIELCGKVFSGVRWGRTDGFLPTPESFMFNRAFVIENTGKQVGRLYAEASMAVRPKETGASEFILFKVTARVNHKEGEGRGLTESIQLAHDWVVHGFADLTDRRIQDERWERQS